MIDPKRALPCIAAARSPDETGEAAAVSFESALVVRSFIGDLTVAYLVIDDNDADADADVRSFLRWRDVGGSDLDQVHSRSRTCAGSPPPGSG